MIDYEHNKYYLYDATTQTFDAVIGWQPIDTAPKNEWILIADDACWPPDLVRWTPERPERIINGNRYLAVPAGWMMSPGGRSRFDVPDGHLMKATRWHPIPNKNDATLEEIHGKENCHICGKPKAGKGGEYCSYPHGMMPDQPVDEAGGMWSWKVPNQ